MGKWLGLRTGKRLLNDDAAWKRVDIIGDIGDSMLPLGNVFPVLRSYCVDGIAWGEMG